MLTPTWENWLDSHHTAAAYDENPTVVMGLANGGSSKEIMDKVSKCKNVVVLTLAPMGKKLQDSFYFSIIGTPVLPTEMRYVARVGQGAGRGVEIDLVSVFNAIPARRAPTLLDMMKVEKAQDFEELQAHGPERGIRSFACLPPALAKKLRATDMTATSVFLTTVEHIKATIAPKPTSTEDAEEISEETKEDNADDILTTAGGPYETLLRTVWAMHALEEALTTPIMAPLQDPACLEWESATDIKKGPSVPPVVTEAATTGTARSAGSDVVMMKLAESITKHNEVSQKWGEEKADPRLKAWRKLPKIQQNIIIYGGIEEDSSIPEEATEEMLSILGCQNGAQVEQYLRQSMKQFNMAIEPGLCTALNKGILVSIDDGSAPRNLTPFFTPPLKDDEERTHDGTTLSLAVKEKFEDRDVSLLTKMDITIPFNTQDLRHHVKNYAALLARCFGEDSRVHMAIKKISTHMEKKEMAYTYEFRQEKLFGGHFLDRINRRVHRFLDSCAKGEIKEVDVNKLEFDDLLEQLENFEYNTKVPAWIRTLLKKRGSDSYDDTNSGGGETGGRYKRRQVRDSGEKRKIEYPNVAESCKLSQNEP